MNIKFFKDLTNDSFKEEIFLNTFYVFKSVNDIFYLVYSNRNLSIIFHNLIDDKKIGEIKNAHSYDISNFRHKYDQINHRDLLFSISFYDNNIKLWNINNLECLINIRNINSYGFLYSACFLQENDQIYIITSNFVFGGTYVESIKIYDLTGINIKEINDSNYDTYTIDAYYDKKLSKNYIITSNYNYSKSYDYNNNELYHKYYECESFEHRCIIINDYDKDLIKLIESSADGNIRIWDFHKGFLLKKIKIINEELYGICQWSNDYIFVGCKDKCIRLVDIIEGKIIKLITSDNFFGEYITIIKIIHPYYGECLLSQGFLYDNIKLWINKK
jgi:WD40 repeat protein